MDQRTDIRDFLTSRRARVTPEQAGIVTHSGKRRVPGLRREEVALLAGVSADYYTRLERGTVHGASDSVLNAVARVLQFDEAERLHLFELVKTKGTARRSRRPAKTQIRPSIRHVLDALVGVPAWISNDRLDLLAANQLCEALYSDLVREPNGPANIAKFLFLEGRSREFFVDWEDHAEDAVAMLRRAAGRDPHDRNLTGLVGELSTRSEEFRVRWAAHNVRFHRSGLKALNHSAIGRIDLTFEAMDLLEDAGLTLYVMTAEPNSPSAEGLKLLGSLAATEQVESVRQAE